MKLNTLPDEQSYMLDQTNNLQAVQLWKKRIIIPPVPNDPLNMTHSQPNICNSLNTQKSETRDSVQE